MKKSKYTLLLVPGILLSKNAVYLMKTSEYSPHSEYYFLGCYFNISAIGKPTKFYVGCIDCLDVQVLFSCPNSIAAIKTLV